MEGVESPHMDCSLVLLKPEANGQTGEAILETLLGHPDALMHIPDILFDKERAARFWDNLAGRFDWVDAYYEHMASGPCHAVVLKGADTAGRLKEEIRSAHQKEIGQLNSSLGTPFSPDLIHGSDNGNFPREISLILDCVEI